MADYQRVSDLRKLEQDKRQSSRGEAALLLVSKLAGADLDQLLKLLAVAGSIDHGALVDAQEKTVTPVSGPS